MLERIYSSKLYKLSTRKSKIDTAIQNPINVELVKQLREYLDDEYLSSDYLDTKGVPEDRDDVSIKPSESHGGGPSGGGGGGSFGDLSSELSDNTSGGDDFGPIEPLDDDANEAEDVGEAVKIKSKTIKSSSTPMSIIDSVASQLDSIKGMLNSREDTSEVSRILLRENECWIYYNDKVNLNNVMEPVISVLNASGYTYLDFNRLARTDNAIVFEVLKSVPPIQALGNEDE